MIKFQVSTVVLVKQVAVILDDAPSDMSSRAMPFLSTRHASNCAAFPLLLSCFWVAISGITAVSRNFKTNIDDLVYDCREKISN